MGARSYWKTLQLTISGHLKIENGSKQHFSRQKSGSTGTYSSTGNNIAVPELLQRRACLEM